MAKFNDKLVLTCSAKLFCVAALTVAGTSLSIANEQTFSCELDGEARGVVVSYGEQNRLPCEVSYFKQGNAKTLWRAENEVSFCGERAQELIAKLERNGWACQLDLAELPRLEP